MDDSIQIESGGVAVLFFLRSGFVPLDFSDKVLTRQHENTSDFQQIHSSDNVADFYIQEISSQDWDASTR